MRSFKSLSLILSFVTITTAVHSRADEVIPGYLPDFQYQLTDVGARGAIEAFQKLNRNTEMTSICANRANLWSYEMDRRSMKETGQRLQSGKIFVFFTEATQDPVYNTEDKLWWYHVAPVVLADGQIRVIDGAFPRSIRGPVSIEQWNANFANGHKCYELKGDADADMIAEIRFQQALTQKKGTCYYRITPMYYLSPLSIVWHDVDSKKSPEESPTPGINTKTPFNATRWIKADLVGSCQQGQDRGFSLRSKKKWCEKFLGLGKWADGTNLVSDY